MDKERYNPYQDIRTFEDLLDRLDLLLTTAYYSDFRIGYTVAHLPSYRAIVEKINEAFVPFGERGSYQFFVMSRYSRWTQERYEPVRRTLLMDYRSETISEPPEREREPTAQLRVNPSIQVCRACGGLGGIKFAAARPSAVPEGVWSLPGALAPAVDVAASNSPNEKVAASASFGVCQGARDLGVPLERGVIQVITGGTLFGFDDASNTRIALTGYFRSWDIELGGQVTASEAHLINVEPGWRIPCRECDGRGANG